MPPRPALAAALVAAALATPVPATSQAATDRDFPAPAQPAPTGILSNPRAGATDGVPAPTSFSPAGPSSAGESAPGWMVTPAGAFGASLVIPGSGQAALGRRRWILYGLAEVGFWALRIDAVTDERRFRGRYRDLAWEVARLQEGERRDGGFGYYEAMSHYLSSGAYDRDPGAAGVQPETDIATYNGTVWDLARRQFLPGGTGGPGTPEYDRAIAYYEAHSAGPGFLWSWTGSESELERFRALIDRTDDEARLATSATGLVLANHLLSAIDALVIARLRSNAAVRLQNELDGPPRAPRWRLGLELPTPY